MRATASDTKLLVWTLGLLLFVYALVTAAALVLADFTSGLCGFSRHPSDCAESHWLSWTLWLGAGAALAVGMLVIGLRGAKGSDGMRLVSISMAGSFALGALSYVAG